LKDPQKYERIGARLRRGVLIYGPPGTGKTLLAKATAGESESSFLYCTASEFVEIYVGMGQKRVRELFDHARRNSPCIIFIDEIDGIGMRRERNFGGEKGADMERSTTLNQVIIYKFSFYVQ
jgi:cell division protease FtsH